MFFDTSDYQMILSLPQMQGYVPQQAIPSRQNNNMFVNIYDH